MDNLRAAILRPQLRCLDRRCAAWTARYRAVEDGLQHVPGIRIVERREEEDFVGSSFQFMLPDWPPDSIEKVVAGCSERGVELKWFGAPQPVGFTSKHDSWGYAGRQELPQTDRVLSALLDMRLPLTFSIDDCRLIARIIRDEVAGVYERGARVAT